MTYDELLGELQALLGTRVAVMVGPMISADGEVPYVARLQGELGWASEDRDAHAEEMLVFWVGQPDQDEGESYFTIRRRLFDHADWTEAGGYRQLIVMQAGVWLSVTRLDP